MMAPHHTAPPPPWPRLPVQLLAQDGVLCKCSVEVRGCLFLTVENGRAQHQEGNESYEPTKNT